MENNKIKLMISYGGKINHRTHDQKLTYIGGDTKILTVDRTVSFTHLVSKLSNICDYNNYNHNEIRFKYKLPGQDLDALVSVFDDDDVENMLYEYDYLKRVSHAPPRFRLFVFVRVTVTVTTPVTPDFLFGFDKEYSAVGYNGIAENTDFQVRNNVLGESVTRGNYVYQAPAMYGGTGAYLQSGGGGDREQAVVYGLIPGGNREQAVVYRYLPVMPLGGVGTQEQRNIPSMNGSPLSYDPTVKMAATLDRDSKVVANGAQLE